jgi:D-glucosaminate-specific PTS system IIB component
MANIVLVRVDFRLIHGQVITKWRKVFNVTKCIIVDNDLVKDEFLSKIYVSAAPSDMKVKIYDEDKAVRIWEKNQFGEGNVLLLFNNVGGCFRLAERGVKFPSVQLGGLPASFERKTVAEAVAINSEEMDLLTKIQHDFNVNVYAQVTPEKVKVNFGEITKNFSS